MVSQCRSVCLLLESYLYDIRRVRETEHGSALGLRIELDNDRKRFSLLLLSEPFSAQMRSSNGKALFGF